MNIIAMLLAIYVAVGALIGLAILIKTFPALALVVVPAIVWYFLRGKS